MLGLLALASGLGLVTLVGWSLVQTTAQSRTRAELDARTRARELAQGLRAALRSPAVLHLVDPTERFEVTDGQLAIPPHVGWITQRRRRPADAVVAERLRRARIAEFVDCDANSATAQFDELLGPQGPKGDEALPVALAAAWQAQRAGRTERCATLERPVTERLADLLPSDLGEPRYAELTAGAALLAAARGDPLPEKFAQLLPALPAALATATFDRLAERGIDTSELRAQSARVQTQRELLTAVTGQLVTLPNDAITRATADRLLLWFPGREEPAAGTGAGALASPDVLQRLVGHGTRAPATIRDLPPVPDVEGLCFLRPTGDHEEVVPDLAWVAPAALPMPQWFARPTAVIAATLSLVLLFGGSLWFVTRAMRRETIAVRARSEFLTGVTHELKTPIASIRLVAEVLTDDDVPPPKQREYFALLAGESARLSMLIENVLDLGQMERGERAYDLRPGDLSAIVRDAVELFRPLADGAGMQLLLREGPTAAAAIVDGGALQQALLAVFENARKYAAAGVELEVTTTGDNDTFTILVSDRGPGVPAAERETIFTRFHRGGAHRHGSIPGVGLGLYLARAIVQHNGGTLASEARAEGPGACFRFTLPLDPSVTQREDVP